MQQWSNTTKTMRQQLSNATKQKQQIMQWNNDYATQKNNKQHKEQ
jgi:hypothetical protein